MNKGQDNNSAEDNSIPLPNRSAEEIVQSLVLFQQGQIAPSEFWLAMFGSLAAEEVDGFLDGLKQELQSFLLEEYVGLASYRFLPENQITFSPFVRRTIGEIGRWLENFYESQAIRWRRFQVAGLTEPATDRRVLHVGGLETQQFEFVDLDLHQEYPSIDLAELPELENCFWLCSSCRSLVPTAAKGIHQCSCGNVTTDWQDKKLMTRDNPISVRLIRFFMGS